MLVDGVPSYRTAGIYITTINLYDNHTTYGRNIPVLVAIEPGWEGAKICSAPFTLAESNIVGCLVLENHAFKELYFIDKPMGTNYDAAFVSNYCIHTYTP
jgi:hypothetical protein